jgi:hypothetical protein
LTGQHVLRHGQIKHRGAPGGGGGTLPQQPFGEA